MFGKLRLLLARPSDFDWHRSVLSPLGRRDIYGNRLSPVGQVWRRLGCDGRWQYKQDEATEQDYIDNAW
ncbi:hypothetical protein OZ411_01375 [Bradyrhizobium sp. Arg237L]|uniref:hypothetical protein n=1 Tax=Bradyrhizobium sp. Arg237L TaxID=3003352 RepID=UPI00249F89FF|nr:hypothetical protein [Bradyrhizobium sp. Arg237L]MDI4231464.1 hypothetical protein [Bradyrhizobium sp. Arg237L]